MPGVFTEVIFVGLWDHWVLVKGHSAIEQRVTPIQYGQGRAEKSCLQPYHPPPSLAYSTPSSGLSVPTLLVPLPLPSPIMILVLPLALLPLVLAMPSQVAKQIMINWCLNLDVGRRRSWSTRWWILWNQAWIRTKSGWGEFWCSQSPSPSLPPWRKPKQSPPPSSILVLLELSPSVPLLLKLLPPGVHVQESLTIYLMPFQGTGTSQQGCSRIIPWCYCDQIQWKQCWHLNNPTIKSKLLN